MAKSSSASSRRSDAPLSTRALNRALLARQMLLRRETVTPLRAIERVVGLQAQVPKPPFVGLWTRLTRFGRDDLLRPLRDRTVVRATAMRGTIHLLSTGDYLDVRPLLAEMLERGADSIVAKRIGAVDRPTLLARGRAFFGATPAPFEAFRDALDQEQPDRDTRAMAYTVRMGVPLVMVPDASPWGFSSNASFALAERWLGGVYRAKGGTLEQMVLRYLAAFGPATPADCQTWSGVRGLRDTFETLRPKLVALRDEKKRELFDLPDAPRPDPDSDAPVRFLPEYDNVLLSHADRSRIVADAHRRRVIVNNLRVVGTFLVDGFVAGTYRTEEKKKSATLTLAPFGRLPRAAKAELQAEGERLMRFLAPETTALDLRIDRG